AVDDQALALLVLRHRGFATAAELAALGLPAAGLPVGGAWLADESRWTALKAGAAQAYEDWRRRHPLAAGMPTDAPRRTSALPAPGPVDRSAAAPGFPIENGHARRPEPPPLPPAVDRAVRSLERALPASPSAAPDAHRLAALGLGPRELAAAARAGRLLRL